MCTVPTSADVVMGVGNYCGYEMAVIVVKLYIYVNMETVLVTNVWI